MAPTNSRSEVDLARLVSAGSISSSEPKRHFRSVEGNIKQAPGTRTVNANRAVSDMVRRTLDRVRRNIRDRNHRLARGPA